MVDVVAGSASAVWVSGDEGGKLSPIGRRVVPRELGVGTFACALAVVLGVPVLELKLGVLWVVLPTGGDIGDDDKRPALEDDTGEEPEAALS